MGAALYPVLKTPDSGIDVVVDGTALSQAVDFLDDAARRVGVTPLRDYVSFDDDAYGVFEEAGVEIPAPTWFAASDGLRTVGALLEAARHASDVNDALLADLQALEVVLIQADARRIRWHLAVDI